MEAKGWKRHGHSQGQAMKGQGHAPLPSPPLSSFTSPPNSFSSCYLFLLLSLFHPPLDPFVSLSFLQLCFFFLVVVVVGGGRVVSPSLTPFANILNS